MLAASAGTCAPGLPYCTYGLRVPASRVLYVPRGAGQPAPRAPRAVRTGYACQPRACRAYRVPWLSPQVSVEEPPKRKAGVMVASVDELVDKLKNEAKCI